MRESNRRAGRANEHTLPAKLPDNFIRKAPPKVGDLAPGSEAFVSVFDVRVDLDHSVYVRRNIELSTARDKCAKIRRDEKGAYHLDLSGIDHQFEIKDQTFEKGYGLLVPIESVSGIGDRK